MLGQPSRGQPNPNAAAAAGIEQEMDMLGDTNAVPPHALLATQLQLNYDKLSDQDAVDLAALLHAAKADPETIQLVHNMKQGSGQSPFQDFTKDTTPAGIVKGLQETMNEFKALDILFANPVQAVEELIADGMVPPDEVDMYRNDPQLLEDSWRKVLYFTLISHAAAGGYL
jgi:hypothetical protein